MKSPILKTLVIIAIAALLVPASFAQCISDVPARIDVHTSYCIRVCASDFAYPAIQLYGDQNGPAALPILILQPGCAHPATSCDVQCTAITPPPYPFVLGGDPYFPDNYYGHNGCFDMYLYWVHDNVWALEIYTLCSGCFCLSYDHQLPVELTADGLTADEGDQSVTLKWATASETDNDHFEITRNGASVGRIASQGGTGGYNYTWVDNSAANDVTYSYKLLAVSVNGNRRELGRVLATPHVDARGSVTEYALLQNYPNPFNPSTSISFAVLEANHVTLKVFNPMGECVATLVNSNVSAGRHTVSFDGSNLTSGLYFYSITIGDRFSATRKMLLIK